MLPDPALASPWLPDPDGDWVGEVSPSPIRESVSGAERGEAELKEEPWRVGGRVSNESIVGRPAASPTSLRRAALVVVGIGAGLQRIERTGISTWQWQFQ